MGAKITSHAAIEEIVEAFLDRHQAIWIKPERSPAVNLVPFIIKSLKAQHKTLCLQHIHDMIGEGTVCKHCGFGGDSIIGAMSGHYDYGTEI